MRRGLVRAAHPVLASLTMATLMLAGCGKHPAPPQEQEPEQQEQPVEPSQPAPPPPPLAPPVLAPEAVSPKAEPAPEPAVPADQQVLDDADATGMTARVQPRNDSDEAQPGDVTNRQQ